MYISSALKGIGGESKSITTRSSMNDMIPASARSVSFKESVLYENNDSPSSKSSVLAANPNSVLDRLGISIFFFCLQSIFMLN